MQEEQARQSAKRNAASDGEEDQRLSERERMYKEQRARERAKTVAPIIDLCGWRGVAAFDDLPTIAGAQSQIPASGPLFLTIDSIEKDGRLTGRINGLPYTGTINTKREFHIFRGEQTVDWDELWGRFTEDGRIASGRWLNVTTNKRSRGEFTIQANCMK